MGLWIAAIVILSLSFLGMFIFGLSNYQETFKTKFSVLNMFPYELSFHNQGQTLIFYRFFLYLYVAFSLTPSLLMVSKFFQFPGYMAYLIMISIIFVINAVVLLTMHIIQAKFVRLHTLIATAYLALSVLGAGAVSIVLFNLFISNNQIDVNYLILGVLEALAAFVLLVIMLNPRLRNWAEMNTEENDDGTVVITRPKIFILALSEWLAIFINFAVQIMLLIAYL